MGPAVANHLWQSTAFAVVAWGVALALRKNQARARYWVWMAASVKFVAPFALLMGLGGMLPRPQHAVVTMPVYSVVDEVGLPFDEMQGTGIREQGMEGSSQFSVVSSQKRLTWPVVLAGIWLGGVVVVVAVWCGGWLKVMRTLRRAVPAEPALAKPGQGTRRLEGGREVELLRRVERREGMHMRLVRAVPLLLSREWMEPGIFGMWRPVLIWPAGLSERLDDDQVEAILAHELAHARRRDNLTAMLHMLVEAAFWFHPVVWWLGARLVEERERACDEAVVEMGSRPGVYAESLLKAVRFCVESPLKCVAGVTGADLKQRVRAIMTARVGRLGWGKKLLLAAAVVGAMAVPVVLGQAQAARRMMLAAVNAAPRPVRAVLGAAMAHAMIAEEQTPSTGLIAEMQAPSGVDAPLPQGQAEDKPFHFDVVSIRPSKPSNQSGQPGGYMRLIGDGLEISNMSLNQMLSGAYQHRLQFVSGRILGLPDWAKTEEFDVQAKVADSDIAEWGKISHSARRPDQERIDLSLLLLATEQFKLKTHSENRDEQIYALVVAKGGPKLKPSTSDEPATLKMLGPGHLSITGEPLDGIAEMCAQMVGRKVVDKTGLTGKYDYTLDWTAYEGPAAAAAGSEPDASQPPVFTVVQEQLGLKLESEKGPVEYIVVDHAEKPESMVGADPPKQSLDGAPTDQRQELHGVYKVWLDQDVRWVITDQEAEAFKRLTNDEERDKFIEQFWQRRNPNPDSPDNAYRDEIYARIAYANEHFASGQPGWMTDRGHAYIVYGKPDEIDVQPADGTQIWRYRYIPGVGDNVVLKFGEGERKGDYRLMGPWPQTQGTGNREQGTGAVVERPNPLKRRLSDAAFMGGAQAAAPPPEFAVSTVKLDNRASNFSSGMDTENGMLRAGNVTLKRCIMGSYGVGPEQVVGGPDWVDTLRFDIVAKADQPVADDAVMNSMLQRLLADRFKLALHRETRSLEAYVLGVDKKGAKLALAKGGDSSTNTETNQAGVTITARNTGMGLLAEDLARVVELPVVDQTGLKGIYDFTLHWTPDNLRTVNNADSISIFAAIVEQLGLRLRATKAPVEVLVIDHAEMPGEN
jgi:uncharacterized protein (TIGR03435 family)